MKNVPAPSCLRCSAALSALKVDAFACHEGRLLSVYRAFRFQSIYFVCAMLTLEANKSKLLRGLLFFFLLLVRLSRNVLIKLRRPIGPGGVKFRRLSRLCLPKINESQ